MIMKTTIWIIIVVCLGIGAFFGMLLGFYWNYKEIKMLSKELDSKTFQLNSFLTKYEDDGYEAY